MPIDIKNGCYDEDFEVDYNGYQLKISIRKPNKPHDVSLKHSNNHGEAFRAVSGFWNELSWFNGIEVVNLGGGYSDCTMNFNYSANENTYLLNGFEQKIFDKIQHLALSFYREGFMSNSAFYTFQSYYKILEIPFENGKEKGKWIDDSIPLLRGEMAGYGIRRIESVISGQPSIGMWLLEVGRNALSHAYKEGSSIGDPNCYDYWQNIVYANELVKALAKKLMIEKLDIQTGCDN